jgi:hypothetical protein
MLRVEGSPALSGCLMNIWWAHQSSSGGADSSVPLTPGALPPGAPKKACRSTYGNRVDGSSKEPVLGRVSREGSGEHCANLSPLLLTTGAPRGSPNLENREVTMQPCITIRTAKLCFFYRCCRFTTVTEPRLVARQLWSGPMNTTELPAISH